MRPHTRSVSAVDTPNGYTRVQTFPGPNLQKLRTATHEWVSQTRLFVVESCGLDLDENLAVLERWDIFILEHSVELVQATLVLRLPEDNRSGTLGDVGESHW